IGAMVWSLDLRSTTTLILLALLPVALIQRPKTWRLAMAGAAAVVLLGAGLFVARAQISGRPPAGVVEDVVLQIRHRRAQEAAPARSQIRTLSDVISAEGRPQIPEAEAASDAAPFSFGGDV